MAVPVGIKPGNKAPRPVKSHLMMMALRDTRIEKGISLTEFAKMTGFHIRTLIRWENGGSSPKLDDFSSLCAHLDLVIQVFDIWDTRIDE